MNSPGLPFATTKPPKARKCRNRKCRAIFVPVRPLQTVCGPLCALDLIEQRKAKQAEQQAKVERKDIKARKQKLKTRRDYINEAQRAFNAFIRERDKTKECICCGLSLCGESSATGGNFDCGHYRSVGSASHLRFDERNAHGQRKQCNRYGAGRAVDYRIGLISRIGLEAVEALEADQEPRKHTIEELVAIRDTYRAKLKALKEVT